MLPRALPTQELEPGRTPRAAETDPHLLITLTRSTGTDGAIVITINNLPEHEDLRVLCGDDLVGSSIHHHQQPADHPPRAAATVQLRIPLTALAYQPPTLSPGKTAASPGNHEAPPFTAISLLAAYAAQAAHLRAADPGDFIREAHAEPDVIVSEVLAGTPADLPGPVQLAVRDLTHHWISTLTEETFNNA